MTMQATGVILSGGKSSRMKFNKAFADIAGQSLMQILLKKFTEFFDETIIISNEPELYRYLGLKIYEDIYPGLGPMSGIHSALTYANTENIFVTACDMPFINMQLVEYMLSKVDGHDVVVPQTDNFLQVTAAVYNKRCLPILSDCLKNDKLKVRLIFKELNTLIISEEELSRFGEVKDIFFNINDEQDLVTAREMSRRLLE